MVTVAFLYAERAKKDDSKSYYRYFVRFEDEVIVSDSQQPECDACRVLQARGISGYLELRDALTGRPRYTVHIETYAKLRFSEPDKGTGRFLPWEPFPGRPERR